MHIVKPMAGLRLALLAAALAAAGSAQGAVFQKDEGGQIRPFKIREMPLAQFIEEYSRFSGTPISIGEETLKGAVSIFVPKPMSAESLAETFHQVLLDNGYSVVDAPAQGGWIVLRGHDVRDLVIPVYDSKDVPSTYRIVTVFHHLRYSDSENVARTLRSFSPAASRIVPATRSDILVTDSGKNIRKVLKIVDLIDRPGAPKKSAERAKKSCPGSEQKIEKLVVQNLEIQNGGFPPQGSPSFQLAQPSQGLPPKASAPTSVQSRTRGAK